MAAIFALSSLTAPEIERATTPVRNAGMSFLVRQGTTHAVEFGVMAVLAFRLFRTYTGRAALLWVCVLAVTVGYAATDEFHQGFVPGRVPSWRDIGFDSLGAVIGLFIAQLAAWTLPRSFASVQRSRGRRPAHPSSSGVSRTSKGRGARRRPAKRGETSPRPRR
jgi:VanZ family protein